MVKIAVLVAGDMFLKAHSGLRRADFNSYMILHMIPREASVAAEKDMLRRMHRQAEIVEALGLLDDAPNQKNGDDIS